MKKQKSTHSKRDSDTTEKEETVHVEGDAHDIALNMKRLMQTEKRSISELVEVETDVVKINKDPHSPDFPIGN